MFWWLRYSSILKYLERSKDSEEKKQKVLDKYEIVLDSEISKLPSEKWLDYLFNEDICIILRNKFIDRINSSLSKRKSELLLLASKRNYTLGELENYYKICGNCVVIEELLRNKTLKEIEELLKRKDNDIINALDNKDIPFLYKRLIIDSYKSDHNMVCRILSSVKDSKVIDYAIYGNKYNSRVIPCILFTIGITDTIKDKIIKYQIDSSNVIDILLNPLMAHESFRNTFFLLKNDEIIQNIMSIDLSKIEEVLEQSCCTDLSILLYKNRYDDIVKVINKLETSELLLFISKCNYEEVVNLCYNIRENDINKSIKDTSKIYYIEILLSKNIKEEIKHNILNTHRELITEEIKSLRNYQILDILNSSQTLEELKDMTYDLNIDVIKDIVLDFNIYDIMKYFFSKSIYNRMKDLIIDLAINSNNIFTILNRNYMNVSECEIIMDRKNILLRSYLKGLEPTALVKFVTEPDLPTSYKDYILNNNIDIVREKLNSKRSECFLLVPDLVEVPCTIKSVLLEGTNIDGEDIDSVFTLAKYCKDGSILDRYNDIKGFIESLGIEFKLFLQYGSGSRKYKKWYSKLIKIFDNNKEEEFKKVSNYLFRYYYINDEDNDINAIKDFLEILNNFDKYNELFMYIINNNYILTHEDKVNLQFIFNEEVDISIKEPNDLDKAKDELYQKYLRRIDKPNITLDDVRSIFNDMLLSDADNEFDNIGNRIGLLKLREKNKNSKVITSYIDALLEYVDFIEYVNDNTNVSELSSLLKYLLETNIDDFIKLKNEFSNIDRRIKRLFELDSQVNLTNVEKASKTKGVVIDTEYGDALDFSDKNYILYAHVLSESEKVEDIINGKSSGDKNFISLSPISYLGQKYYYGYKNKVTFAYDKISNGSFIRSSKANLGSNNLIKRNSSEVKNINSYQEGILDTSDVVNNNAEALLYREGIKPCGLILVGGRKPTPIEIEIHNKYNLPFIITQDQGKSIDNVKEVFGQNNEYFEMIEENKILKKIQHRINSSKNNIDTDIYTGREIAVFSDSHAMYEPTLEIFEDIRNRGISEIYSLGDNIGLGPNPSELFDMLDFYNVKSICGNSEYYNTLGIAPFKSYFDNIKTENQLWTEDKLGTKRIERMKLWPPSINIKVGNRKVGLCHFINDIRWDFNKQNTWSYQSNFVEGVNSKQFLYTNSKEAHEDMKSLLKSLPSDQAKGVIDAMKHPILGGKMVTDYDTILQGHVHFDMKDHVEDTQIYTLRGAGMGYKSDRKDTACYYILKEKKDGTFDIERVLIRFDKHKLLQNVESSSIPHKGPVLKMLK